jgi:hypothetical protein
MPKNSAAQEKKVNAAVRFLQTTTGVKVPQAMIVARFLKADTSNEIMRQMIRRRYQQAINNTPAMINNVVIGDKPSISDLTNDDVQSPKSASSSGSTNPKPKCKLIRLTSRAKQQQRVDDLKIKTHKSEANKAAMRDITRLIQSDRYGSDDLATLLRETEAICRSDPSFKLIEDWQAATFH